MTNTLPLNQWRRDRRLSVRALAEITGLSTKTIIDIEKGRSTAQPRTIRLLARALGLSPADIAEFAPLVPSPLSIRPLSNDVGDPGMKLGSGGEDLLSIEDAQVFMRQHAHVQMTTASSSIPDLRALFDDLLHLASGMDLAARINDVFERETLESDARARAEYMVASYGCKQVEHARAVRTLIEQGLARDALLIARVMAEGAAQLRWAVDRQPAKTDEWFYYGIIEEWRTVEANWRKGRPVDADVDRMSERILSRVGGLFLTNEARALEQAGQPMPADPYRKQWYTSKIQHIFGEAAYEEIYEGLYRSASGWAHWSPRSISLSIFTDDGTVAPGHADPRMEAIALAASSLFLLLMLQIVDHELQLGHEAALREMEDRLTAIVRPSTDAPDRPRQNSMG